jgi:hypothetical protein
MKILKRAKELTLKGIPLPCSEPLLFFLQNKVTIDTFDAETLDLFAQMILILWSIKILAKMDDFILSSLSKMIVNRDLLKIKLTSEK